MQLMMLYYLLFLLIISYQSTVSAQSYDFAQSVTAPSVICQGSDATLQCVVLRNGQPVDARWRRNGILIDTFTDSSYESVLNHTLNAITILLILNIRLEDNNVEYSCSDSNNNINSTVILNVTDKPNTAVNVRIIGNNTSESFVVQWDEVIDIFSINYIVRWSGEDGSSGMDTVDRLSYTVTGLTPDTSYNITVAGNNTCGVGPVSNIIMTSTPMGPSTTESSSNSLSTGAIVTIITFVIIALIATP